MKRTMKRGLALVLSVLMLMTAVPLMSFAGEDETPVVTAVCNSETCKGETRELFFVAKEVAPTCEKKGYENAGYACTVCGEGVTKNQVPAAKAIPALGHDLKKEDAKDATCTTDGNIDYYVCEREGCGKLFLDAEATQPTTLADVTTTSGGHKMEAVSAKAATCKDTGNAAYYYCTECKKYFEDAAGEKETTLEAVTIAVDESKHEYTAKTVSEDALKTPADCLNAAVYYYSCAVCGKVEKNDANTFTDGEALGHSDPETLEWVYPKNVEGQADVTCLTGGKIYKYCERCGIELAEKTVEPLNMHQKLEMVSSKEPTCTEPGNEVGAYCSVCKEVVLEAKVIPAKGHTMTKHDAVESTCTKNGNVAYYDCSVCKKLFLDEEGKTETTEAATVLPLAEHDYKPYAAHEATCTEDGNEEGMKCEVCGHFFGTVVEAAGHQIELKTAKDADCKSAGYKEHYECTVCHAYFEDEAGTTEITDKTTIDIPQLAHQYEKDAALDKEVTCTEDGRKYEVCKLCGDIIDEVIKAEGHKYSDEFTVDEEPTCQKEGRKSKHCTVCGEADPASVTTMEKVDHKIITTETPATCTTDGEIIKTCAFDCGYRESTPIKAVGNHSINQETGKCDRCGEQICTCLCHKTEWYNQFIYFFVRVWWEFLGMRKTCECGRVHYTAARV